MTIKRNINDVETEIKLTSTEMRQIYWAQKELYDAEDIRSRYIVPDDKIDEAVDEFENAIGNNDIYWDCYWMAIDYVCSRMGFKEVD